MKKAAIFIAVFLAVFLGIPSLTLPFITSTLGLNIGPIEVLIVAVMVGLLAFVVAKKVADRLDKSPSLDGR